LLLSGIRGRPPRPIGPICRTREATFSLAISADETDTGSSIRSTSAECPNGLDDPTPDSLSGPGGSGLGGRHLSEFFLADVEVAEHVLRVVVLVECVC